MRRKQLGVVDPLLTQQDIGSVARHVAMCYANQETTRLVVFHGPASDFPRDLCPNLERAPLMRRCFASSQRDHAEHASFSVAVGSAAAPHFRYLSEWRRPYSHLGVRITIHIFPHVE